jgi:dienelactone hydrolase
MAGVVLFHHAQGLTDGIEAFAGWLREAGHAVHTPDLYDGRVFADLESGVAHAESIGFDTILERGVAAAAGLGGGVVYAGFSLGVLPAQRLAQTLPEARGALLYHSAVPTAFFGGGWPREVPVQIHLMTDDPWDDGDSEAAEAICAEAADGTLARYPVSDHLFADPSLPGYDPGAAGLLLQRTLAFLDRIDRKPDQPGTSTTLPA